MTTKAAGARLRGPDASQRPTFLELFFDLAFVFALSQVSRELSQHLYWSGAFQTLVLLLAVFRVWLTTTWVTDRLDPLAPQVQLLVSVTLLGALVLAVTLPQAFGKNGPVFAGVYVAMQAGRNLYLVIALRGHVLQRVMVRVLLWSGVSALLWVAGASTHGTPRWVLWTLAVAVDYAAYALNFPVPGAGRAPLWEPPTAAEHLADRFRQFFIVALGELIVVSAETFSGAGLAPGRTTAFVVSIATTGLMLRIYICRAGQMLSEAFAAVPMSSRLGLWTGYCHLVMVGGIIVTAVGDEVVIAHPSGRTAPAWALVMLGGPALFLVGRLAFNYAVFSSVSLDQPIGVLALAVLTPVAVLVPPLLTATAAMVVLAGVAIADAAHAWGRRSAEPPSPQPARRSRGDG